jgi:hypothetical protein
MCQLNTERKLDSNSIHVSQKINCLLKYYPILFSEIRIEYIEYFTDKQQVCQQPIPTVTVTVTFCFGSLDSNPAQHAENSGMLRHCAVITAEQSARVHGAAASICDLGSLKC